MVSVVVLALLCAQENAARHAQPSDEIKAILELPIWDVFTTIDAQKIIEETSKALTKGDLLPKSQLVTLRKRRAIAYASSRKFDLGLEDCDAALKMDPNDQEARISKGATFMALGKTAEGLAEFTKLVRLQPNSVEGLGCLSTGYAMSGDFAKGVELANKALAIDPNNARALHIRSQAYFLLGDFRAASNDMSRAIEFDPSIGNDRPEQPYLFRGQILSILGKYSQAIANFKIGLAINHSSLDAKYEIWRAYSESGRHHLALYAARQLVSFDDENPAFWAALAHSFGVLGQRKEAYKALEKALAAQVTEPNALCVLGLALEDQGKYAEALRKYDEALEIIPTNPYAQRFKARLLAVCPIANLRDKKKALELALKICEKTGYEHVGCLRILASAYKACGKPQEAENQIRKSLKLVTKDDVGLKEELEKDLAGIQQVDFKEKQEKK